MELKQLLPICGLSADGERGQAEGGCDAETSDPAQKLHRGLRPIS